MLEASGFTSITNIENVTGGTGADSLTGSLVANTLNGGADTISTGTNDNLADFIRFLAANEFGDTVNNFDATGTAAQIDRVQFGATRRTLFDDGNINGILAFVSGNDNNNGNTAVNLNGTVEALFLNGNNREGLTTGQLINAAQVAAEFNREFALTAANGEATLLVINDTNNNRAAVWEWDQANGGEMASNELTLIGVINANATVTTGSFGFF